MKNKIENILEYIIGPSFYLKIEISTIKIWLTKPMKANQICIIKSFFEPKYFFGNIEDFFNSKIWCYTFKGYNKKTLLKKINDIENVEDILE